MRSEPQNYERARAFAPARHRKVSCYTSSTMSATKVCRTLMACAAVILTDSENFNIGFLRDEAATEAPATAVRRTLVGGYEVFAMFSVLAHGLPLLTTKPQGCEPCGDTHAEPWPRYLVAAANPPTAFRMGFQFFTHN